MSFELCVNWPDDVNISRELIEKAYSLGYTGLAFNYTLNLIDKCEKIRNNKKNLTSSSILTVLAKEGHNCPIKYIHFNKDDLRNIRKKGLYKNIPSIAKNTYMPLNLSCHNIVVNNQFNTDNDVSLDFLQLRRLTIIFDSSDCTPYINALSKGQCNESSDSWSKALFSNVRYHPYDIVAVRPTTQNALNSAISSIECDIISIDISSSPRLPFIIKRPQINLAISRGIFFEIDISQCILNKGNSRKNFFGNLLTLTRHIPHKNIIITNSPSNIYDIKTPIDLSNICYVLLSFDLDRKIKINPNDFINTNAIKVLAKGANRRTFASIIFINKREEDNNQTV